MKRKALVMLLTAAIPAGMLMGCSSGNPEAVSQETETESNSEVVEDEAEAVPLEEEEAKTPEEPEAVSDVDASYMLVWEENFESDSLNLEDWNYEYHEPGWVNNELQEFEACIKTPSGKGLWPAFWMMPTDEGLYGQWPKCGEIDIMEVLGNNTRQTYGTLHFGEPNTQRQGNYILGKGDFADEYHVFACEWEPSEIRFYVDGSLFFTVNDWFTKEADKEAAAYPAPFNQPFYMILNLAVGGDWPGNPDESNEFGENAAFYVDYVRVYQKDSYDGNVTRPVIEQVFREADESGNYVVNGSFSKEEDLTDDEDWKFLLAGTGEGSAQISDNMIHIVSEDAGDLEYSIQLVQPHMPMITGNKYKISFDAYADADRSMIVCVSAPDNDWIRYFPDTSVALATRQQSYEYEFTMTEDDDANGRLEFNMGNQGSAADIHITNIRLESLGGQE